MEIPPSAERAIRAKEEAIEALSDAFGRDLPAIMDSIYDQLAQDVTNLPNANGAFLPSESPTGALRQINALVDAAINGSRYYNRVADVIANLSEIDALNREIHQSLNGIEVDFVALKPQRQAIVVQVTDNVVGDGFNARFKGPIRQALSTNVLRGASIAQTRAALTKALYGTAQVVGLPRHLDLAMDDAIRQYDGAVQDLIAEEFGLNAYLYVGSLIKESRPQCRAWVDKGVLLKSELQQQITWAINSGSGMIPSTTPANFAQNRGGYGCRHNVVPIRV